MKRPPQLLAALILSAVLAASCSSGVDVAVPTVGPTATPSGPVPTPTPAPTPTPPPAGQAQLPDDQLIETGPRVAVQTADGQIFTVLGDGSNEIPLTNPAEGTQNTRPTWSADAAVLAWSVEELATGDAWVRSATFDGARWFEQELPAAASRLVWDPTSSQLATLTPSDLGATLGLVSIPDNSYREVDSGSPFWFAWGPDAESFLVHASGVRLDLVPTEGPSQVLEESPAPFQAPVWLESPTQLMFGDRTGTLSELVVTGADGAGRRALVSYDGYLRFAVAPETGWVAIHVIDPALAPVAEVVTASFQSDTPVDIVDPVLRDELTVIATFGGDPFVVYPNGLERGDVGRVMGFYWSPDGNTLAWLVEREPGTGDCASETAIYEWQFMVDNRFAIGPRFTPTPAFACDYLPQFDQLGPNVSFFSPDGVILTYAGTDTATGERGIWNLDIRASDRPVLIADGEIGVWSPDAAGGGGASSL